MAAQLTDVGDVEETGKAFGSTQLTGVDRVANSVTGIRYHSVPMEIPLEILVVASFYWYWNDPQQFPMVMERHMRNSSSNSLTF